MSTTSVNESRSKRRALLRRTLPVCVAAGVASILVFGSGGSPDAAAQATVPAADEAPGYAVEDFNYPQADKILAEKGIRLKRGDGHIVLAECKSGTNQLEVWSYESVEAICFNVSGNSGWLTMEIPSVFGIRGNDFNTEVDMTTEGEEKTFDVEKNLWTAVGQTADEEGRDFALLEIRTSK
ncbi:MULTISPECIES: hypothetical protein [Streptomyces]|uniref:hypothetical protein n=1 Tax=Streptomyces TaxID=1883 RepID=UPI001CEFC08B|nr:hypothetical protein [Streptomyces hyderabadensis]